MIYVRQVDPAMQTCMFDEYLASGCYSEICFYGNPDLHGHLTPECTKIMKAINDYANGNDVGDILDWYASDATNRDIAKWTEALEKAVSKGAFHSGVIAVLLGLLTGDDYTVETIRGSCQGDWQYVVYPTNRWTTRDVKYWETEYFNLLNEWIVHDSEDIPDGPEEINGYTIYTYGMDDDINEVAEELGVEADEVVLYKHGGYKQVPVYEMVVR